MEPKKKTYKRKRRLGSYPYIGVIFSTTLSLTLLGLTGLLYISANLITESQKQVEVHVYLNSEITTPQKDHILKRLNDPHQSPYVLRVDDIPQVSYMSKEEAVKKYISETGDDYTQILGTGYDPIKANIKIKVKSEHFNISSLKKMKSSIESYDGVFEVDLKDRLKDTVTSTNSNIRIIIYTLLGVGAISALIIVLLIHSSIKLAMFSQRFLIRSMQLVGAKPSFIKAPFIWRTALHGLISGLISSLILYSVSKYIYVFYSLDKTYGSILMNLIKLSDQLEVFLLFAGLCIFGTVIGMLSAQRAVGKYLKMSLDDLY